MEIFETVVEKTESFVNWLDGVNSVPAAIGAFLLGMIVPKGLATLVVLFAVIYAIVKFNSMRG